MHFLWEILQEILREIFKVCKSSAGNAVGKSVGYVVGNAEGNGAGNGLGNDAVFSLNTWLRMIYCLQTIHEPACVILTLFQLFDFVCGKLHEKKRIGLRMRSMFHLCPCPHRSAAAL